MWQKSSSRIDRIDVKDFSDGSHVVETVEQKVEDVEVLFGSDEDEKD